MGKNLKNSLNKSVFAAILAATALSFGGMRARADQHCSCDEKCSEQCGTGQHKDCGCETCSCAKGKKCKHGKCARHSEKAKKAEGGDGAAQPDQH